MSSPTTSLGRFARVFRVTQRLLPASRLVSVAFLSAVFSYVFLLSLLLPVTSARAELADDYLAGLRARGWHDTALEYLEHASDDPLVTPKFLMRIDFERAVTQASLAGQVAGASQRQKLLLQAVERFKKFAANRPKSPQKIAALAAAGNLLYEQASYSLSKADSLPENAVAERKELSKESRGFLGRARNTLQGLLGACNAEIKTLPKAAAMQKDVAARARRDLLKGKAAEARYLLVKIEFDIARTFPAKSKEQQQALKSSIKVSAKLYKDYGDTLAAFFGRFYEGRSYQEIGDLKKALNCYFDIVDQPPIPSSEFHRLVSRAFRRRAECHLINKDFEKVIKECTAWINESQSDEITKPEWLAVSYQLALAYEARAAGVKGSAAKQAQNSARKLYREIAKKPGEFQHDAKTKVASSGSGGLGNAEVVEVKDFEEAFTAGKEALQQMNFTKMAAGLAKENNPSEVASLTEQTKAFRVAAKQYFLQAMQFADVQTNHDELATTYYYLCYLHWEEGHLYEAAVIGEFLARRFPESKFAPVAAKLALAAYERLYNGAKKAGQPIDFASQHLTEVAELLARRWPDSAEAATAVNLMINIALRDNRLADAEKMVESLPAASRATAELRLGGALWTRYLRAQHSKQPADQRANLALKQKAGKLLGAGFKSLQSKSDVTSAEAAGVLYLAQYLLTEGQAKAAIAALEKPGVGPLHLVTNQATVASRPEFVQETYKVALRSYLLVEPSQSKKAQAMMTALESAIGNKAGAQQKLINIYVSLGVQLQQQIKSLTASGQTEKSRAVAEAFAELLTRVTKRAGAADNWKVQNWIARTNLQLGQGLSGKDATRYFEQAEQAFKLLLNKAAKSPKFAPSPIAVLATKKSLADCLQAQGKYSAAFELYAAVLKVKPNMLELQHAAATALQQWGVEAKDSKRLDESIRGAQPQAGGKKLVWGWLRLASIAEQAKRRAVKKMVKDPKQAVKVAKYEALFFEARYHVAEARFAASQLATGATRSKQLRSARQGIKSMQQLYPKLGGPQWQEAYHKLLQEMEQAK